MKLKLGVSKKVKELVLSGQEVIKAKTNFITPPSKGAYQVLKEQSKMDNFFFSFRINHLIDEEAMKGNLVVPEGGCILTLEVPDDKTFSSGYYNFSDLIYYLDCCGESEEDPKYVDYLSTEALKGTISLEEQRELTCGLVQVIFEEICQDWIIDIECIKKKEE